MLACVECKNRLEIFDEDLEFYKKVSVPSPTLCPECRQQRRLAWRNERTLYKRTCDYCDKNLISIYPANTPWPVYCNVCWWSDKWDPMDYAKDYDFSRSFFDQYAELQKKVPRISIYLKNAENSDFCNHAEDVKNSYLSVDIKGEDIYYSKWIIGGSRDLADCYQLEKAELCYESMYSVGTYNCKYVILSDHARDSAFLYYCKGVSNCYMSWNLSHKQYFILNKQFSKQEYEDTMKKVDLGSAAIFDKSLAKFLQLLDTEIPRRNQLLISCESCNGDMIYHCKNVQDSYDAIESQDSRYCYDVGFVRDCYDTYESAFNCELQYDSHACNRGSRLRFSHVSYDVDSCDYVDSCHSGRDLFGNIGLKRKKYCILNKQYSKEEYEEVRNRIIEKMKSDGEFGEFFPISLSPYAYNETVAHEYFPLSKEEVLSRGWRWSDKESALQVGASHTISSLPDYIRDVPENIHEEILACNSCKKPYKVTAQEVRLYKKMSVPIPRKCSHCRHLARLSLRNYQKLEAISCFQCSKNIKAALPRRGSGKIFCEECIIDKIF